MKFKEFLLSAKNAIFINKGRTILSMLGIIIGISSVIAMISIGKGAQNKITSNIQSLGSNVIIVSSGNATVGNVKQGLGSASTLTQNYVDALSSRFNTPDVSNISPVISKNEEIIYKNQNAETRLNGVYPQAQIVNNITISQGSFITQPDISNNFHVIVLGPVVESELFPHTNPIGKTVSVGNSLFTVIGVTQSKGTSGNGAFNQDDQVWIPETTAKNTLLGNINYSTINLEAKNSRDMTKATSEVQNTLMKAQGITNATQANFTVENQTQILSSLNTITGTFTLLLEGIAGISLIVGGIGIMNIMLVSVTERTREIGLRKAVGAKGSDIMTQFLLETIILTLISGTIGILFGIFISFLISSFVIQIPFVISVTAIIIALTVSASIGFIFGLFPAYKASKLSAIEALRYE